jgi:hypothetical protein
MNKLYDKPTSTLTDDPEVELVPAGVLIKIILEYGKYFCKWGPNGIPSEKQFALISAKDALAPYGNNVFKLVMQRQIGQHLRKLPIQSAEQAQNTD